jgi:DNA-binding response OmpR family regulator
MRRPLVLAAIPTAEIRLEVLEGLPNHGWRVLVAGTHREIPALAFQHEPDVLLLETNPGDAIELALAALRIPRLALALTPDRTTLLQLHRELKICNCLPLPLNLDLLAASLDAVHFSSEKNLLETSETRFEPRSGEKQEHWLLSITTWTLTTPQGLPIRLTQAETIFLATLAQSPGATVARPAMISALGHNIDYYDTRRIDTMLSRLRQKISREGSANLPVRSIHSVGYAFAASINLKD